MIASQPEVRSRLAAKLAAFVLLFALPFALRFLPIEHGGLKNYIPDSHVVRSALGMAKDRDLVPPVGKYSHYPNLVPYMLLPAYAAQYALGSWKDAREFGNHLLDHPESARIVARGLVALFGALTTWVAFRSARAMGLGRGAWVSAWLVATGLLHVHFSVQERPWVPMAFFLVLATWPAAVYVREGRAKHLVLSGVAAGLAFACHQGGVATIAIPAIAWLLGPRRELGPRLAHGVACVGAFVLVSLVLGHPYLLRYGMPKSDQVIMGEVVEEGGFSIGGVSLLWDVRPESFTHLSRVLVGYDPAIVILGLSGLAYFWRCAPMRPIVIFVFGWAAFFMTNWSDHARYLLPVTLGLAFPAGLVAERWLAHKWGTVVVGLLLALPLVQAVRFVHVMMAPDTRAEAAARLHSLGADALVAIDFYGPDVDLDQKSMQRLLRLRTTAGESLYAREDRRRLALDQHVLSPERLGINAVRLEEFVVMDARLRTIGVRPKLEDLGADPKSAMKALGVTHFLRVDREPGDPAKFLLAPLIEGARELFVVDPSRGGAHAKEALLPTEMEFPLTALWNVDRPGPRMALYDLRESERK
jgi:hypothetical protein